MLARFLQVMKLMLKYDVVISTVGHFYHGKPLNISIPMHVFSLYCINSQMTYYIFQNVKYVKTIMQYSIPQCTALKMTFSHQCIFRHYYRSTYCCDSILPSKASISERSVGCFCDVWRAAKIKKNETKCQTKRVLLG